MIWHTKFHSEGCIKNMPWLGAEGKDRIGGASQGDVTIILERSNGSCKANKKWLHSRCNWRLNLKDLQVSWIWSEEKERRKVLAQAFSQYYWDKVTNYWNEKDFMKNEFGRKSSLVLGILCSICRLDIWVEICKSGVVRWRNNPFVLFLS